MNTVMEHLLYKDVAVFIRDALIESAVFQKHLKSLERVLHCLQETGFTFKSSNCKSAIPSYKVLWLQFSENGIQQAPAK